MSDDLLGEATRALREELADEDAVQSTRIPVDREGAAPEPARVTSLTRSRIMASLHERRRRRTTRAVMALPLVAVFVAGTAWATQAGVWSSIFRGSSPAAESVAPGDPPREPSVEGPLAPRVAPTASLAPSPAPTEEAMEAMEPGPMPAPAPTAERPPEPTAEMPPRPEPSGGPAPRSAPSSAASLPSEARRLYERAHRAHFEEKNPAAALSAWEAYLAVLPHASKADAAFATEAAYNRALCLVRLGRTGAALQALAPFAEGRYGAYRREEARALVEALSGMAPSGD